MTQQIDSLISQTEHALNVLKQKNETSYVTATK